MFEGFDPTEYEAEARERWGETERYAESERGTASYTDADWRSIRSESEQIAERFAELLAAAADPASEEARAAAERHRRHLSRWFYECSSELHVRLGEMYVQDERFARHWDRHRPGLAEFVRDAIRANGRSLTSA